MTDKVLRKAGVFIAAGIMLVGQWPQSVTVTPLQVMGD
jgi:hypothetical protein